MTDNRCGQQENNCEHDVKILVGAQGPMGPQGRQGDRGVQGLPGAPGPRGLRGDKGDRGPQGDAGPKGEVGAKGEAGPGGPEGSQGDKGGQGPQGIQGSQGIQGPKGDKGDIGEQGPIGPIGCVGPRGANGEQGIQGPKGEQGIQGLKGDTGAQGPRGDRGDTGIQGDTGDTGIQGPKGNTGSSGPMGPEGPKGDKGDTGDKGIKGDKGIQGIQGPKGPKGDKGDKGDTGLVGPQGPQGDVGPKGKDVDYADIAFITATTDMATKTYVNQQDNLKADKETTYTKAETDSTFAKKASTVAGYGITDTYIKSEVDTKILNKSVNSLSLDNADTLSLKLADNTTKTVSLTSVFTNNIEKGIDDSNVKVKQPFIGSVERSLHDKNNDTMSVKDFGAKGDKTTDDTDAIERAITAAEQTGKKLHFPAGIYRLTRTITRRAGSTWQGESCREKGVGGGEIMGGTWLYFDHNDKGIHFSGSAGYFVGIDVNGFGIRRNQVGADGSTTNWQPQDADYDFYVEGMASITISDMLFLCSTKGIYAGGTGESFGTGRVNIYRINGQFFKNAIKIDYCYDVPRIDQVHVWPFWISHDLLHNYMMQNLDVIHLVRCDNPMISNIFSIFARAGLRVSAGAGGGTSKIHLVNCDFDRGNIGLWLDSTCNTVTGHIDNYTSQSETGGSKSICIEGSNNHLQFGNVYVANLDTNAVRVEGVNNKLEFSSLKIVDYDLANVGFPAIEAGTGNTISISSLPSITSKSGKTNKYGTTGNILVDDWRYFSPQVSSATNTISAFTATGSYKVTGSTATVRFDIKIVSNGTASGDVRFNIPFGSIADNSTSSGREIDIEGYALSCTAQVGNNFIIINKFDNTYVGKDGARLVGEIKYRINI